MKPQVEKLFLSLANVCPRQEVESNHITVAVQIGTSSKCGKRCRVVGSVSLLVQTFFLGNSVNSK